MALDLDAIRQRLSGLQNQTGKQNNLWKPAPGKQTIRIVPYQFNKDNPFIELYFHYELNGKTFLSPITNGEADPIVEFAEKLKSTGNRDDWQMSRKLEPKMRTYVPVIVRGKESEGVKFWGFGKTIYTELLSIIADPDYGDITDLRNGRDIDVEFTPAEGGGYPKTAIRVKPNQSPATEDKAVAELILKQPKIEDIYPEPEYSDLEDALQAWMNPENADSDVSNEPSSTTTDEVASQTPTATATSDVGAAFDDLFNN